MKTVTGEAKYIYGRVDGLTYLGSSVLTESRLKIRHYFAIDEELQDQMDEDYFGVELRGSGSNHTSIVEVQNGILSVTICDIERCEWDTYFATVISGDDQTIEIHYNIGSYIYDVLKTSEDQKLIDLAKALYLYMMYPSFG